MTTLGWVRVISLIIACLGIGYLCVYANVGSRLTRFLVVSSCMMACLICGLVIGLSAGGAL